MSNGWDDSAEAWIADMGEHGDFTRRFVLDPVMVARVAGRGFATALDVGCGEGRFCRILRGHAIRPVGIDPTAALLQRARELDPEGDYRDGRAEQLPFGSGAFDLVVSYLTLIDIPDLDVAAAEMARVLRPGGTLLIANLSGFTTAAGERAHWVRDDAGRPLHFPVDRYLDERMYWADWRGIRIHNWHRPLGRYMAAFLAQGLILSVFAEPAPIRPRRSGIGALRTATSWNGGSRADGFRRNEARLGRASRLFFSLPIAPPGLSCSRWSRRRSRT